MSRARSSRDATNSRASAPLLLSVEGLTVHYGAVAAVRDVAFNVHEGEVVALIGANGAGKSSTLRALSGLAEVGKKVHGQVTFAGRRTDRWPAHRVAAAGLVHVPEGRRIFPGLSVEENLLLGGFRRRRDRKELHDDAVALFERFPVLGERRAQLAGLLSGGEQQMLAIARGLMARPRVLLLDEPSLGLAPLLVERVFHTVRDLAATGMTILLVEQLAAKALEVATRGYVLETGRIIAEGPVDDLANDRRLRAAYLGLPA